MNLINQMILLVFEPDLNKKLLVRARELDNNVFKTKDCLGMVFQIEGGVNIFFIVNDVETLLALPKLNNVGG